MNALVSLTALAVAGAATAALADCPTGTMPTQLQVPYWVSGQSHGSTKVAADDGVVATNQSRSHYTDVVIFRRGAAGWTVEQALPLDTANTNVLGSIALSGDTLAASVGTVVHVFKRSPATGAWTETATTTLPVGAIQLALGPSNLVAIGSNSRYFRAFAVAPDGTLSALAGPDLADPATWNTAYASSVSMDGDMLAVGAPADNGAAAFAGAVYVYRLAGGAWTLSQKILPPGPNPSHGFGASVALQGGRLAIGSLHWVGIPADPVPVSYSNGFVNVYELQGGSFTLTDHLTHPRGMDSSPAGFGCSLALSGTRLLVGAFQDSYAGTSSGAAYVFDYQGGSWSPSGTMALQSSAGAWLGYGVALAGGSAFAVAPFHDQGRLACAVFDSCALPSGSTGPQCLPGIGGLMTYLIRWFELDPWADFDRNGRLEVADLMAFLTAWFAGCP